MDMDNRTYQKFVTAHAPRSPHLKNACNAFWMGGSICLLGELLRRLYQFGLGTDEETAGLLTSLSLIFLSALLTSVGVFDRIAKHAGAGTLLPITGFANAVVSSAIDSRAEGLVLGVGAKIFTVAGPVLLYAILSGACYGVIYWILLWV